MLHAMEIFAAGTAILRRFSRAPHALSRTSFMLSSYRQTNYTNRVRLEVHSPAHTSINLFYSTNTVGPGRYSRGILQACLFHTQALALDTDKGDFTRAFPAEFSHQPALRSPIRLIDRDGVNLGVLTVEEARLLAAGKGLHIQIVQTPSTNSPETVCKLATKEEFIDAKKKKKISDKKISRQSNRVKELTMRSSIAEADLSRKIAKMKELLADEYRVKVSIKGKRTSLEKIKPISERIIDELQGNGRLDGELQLNDDSSRFSIVPTK